MDKQYYQKMDTTPPSSTNHPPHHPKFPEKQPRSHKLTKRNPQQITLIHHKKSINLKNPKTNIFLPTRNPLNRTLKCLQHIPNFTHPIQRFLFQLF
jgi:hypothetical protein